jgi:hypothetical protein
LAKLDKICKNRVVQRVKNSIAPLKLLVNIAIALADKMDENDNGKVRNLKAFIQGLIFAILF